MSKSLVSYGMSNDFLTEKAIDQVLRKAVSQIGIVQPAAAILLTARGISKEHLLKIQNALDRIPLWGFTTSAPFDETGEFPGGILLILIAGREVKARVEWREKANLDMNDSSAALKDFLSAGIKKSFLLIAANGKYPMSPSIFEQLSSSPLQIAGAFSCETQDQRSMQQIGDTNFASEALSMLQIGGGIHVVSAMGGGWQNSGIRYMVTAAQGHVLKSLDDQPPAEVYSQIFGIPPQDWSQPPFSEMIRQYPLGIEYFPGSSEVMVRSPIAVEKDGSFLMSAPVIEGQAAYLMVGQIDSCLEAAQSAARQALQSSGDATPIFSLVLADVSWKTLFHGENKALIRAIEKVMGSVPIVGCYTNGQFSRVSTQSELQIHNQEIQVILFCDPS